MNPYADMLSWTLTEFKRMADLQGLEDGPKNTNANRRKWAAAAAKSLRALAMKYGTVNK